MFRIGRLPADDECHSVDLPEKISYLHFKFDPNWLCRFGAVCVPRTYLYTRYLCDKIF